jgi:hypothetical protein
MLAKTSNLFLLSVSTVVGRAFQQAADEDGGQRWTFGIDEHIMLNFRQASRRPHYAYYGVAGNIRALFKVYRAAERYWRKICAAAAGPADA